MQTFNGVYILLFVEVLRISLELIWQRNNIIDGFTLYCWLWWLGDRRVAD